VRTFVTGATGFIGRHLVERLRVRGDEVVALVRSPHRAAGVRDMGAKLAEGDVSDPLTVRRAMDGCDSVFHVAGVYRVGIRPAERPDMYEANVRGTEVVLDAATEARIPRIVHVSTCNVFGNTGGLVVDETYERPVADGFLSYYDETKYLAHRAAVDRIQRGVPIVIAQPGGVYGPGDHSEIGWMLEQLRRGRLRLRMFPELGMTFVFVADAAEGIALAHERGGLGESYVLGGEIATMADLIDRAASVLGRRPPRRTLPAPLIRMAAPLGPLAARLMGTPPNLVEAMRAARGVTYWATDAKARRELGYAPRSLDEGLRQTLAGVAAG
jgi:nucleoside-diphosphate-sugar epimerase